MANGVLIEELKLKDSGFSSGVASAKKSLDELNKANNVTDNQLRKVTKEFNAARRQALDLTAQYNALGDAAKNSDFGRKMAQQIDMAVKKAAELKSVQNEVNDAIANMSKGAGDAASNSITKAFGEISNVVKDKALGNMGGIGSVVGTLTRAAGPIAAIAGGVAVVGDAFVTSTKKTIEFEDALSNLAAITGMEGNDLEKLKQQIINTGDETSKSFSSIADSYTKVGSKMPALLKQPEALDAVTRAVITLAKAARMDLDSATDSLLGIMNQMSASADDASRYINVLAAGAKEGAGGIQYLATAMDKCGTSVASAGLSIEQGTALIEVLAQKIPDASTAGTNLRNILLKMLQGADEFNPRIVGMNKALENLAKHTSDTTFMVKMFGSENVNAAITLAQSATKADELTKAVTGTNEAEKQAQTQTANTAGAIRKLSQDWENFISALNNSQGVLMKTIQFLDKLVIGFRNAVNAKNDYEKGTDTGKDAGNRLIETKKSKYQTSDDESQAKKIYAAYVNDLNKSIKTAIADRDNVRKELKAKSELGDEEGAERALKALRAFNESIKTLSKEAKSVKWSDFYKPKETTTTATTTSSTASGKTKTTKTSKKDDLTFDEQLELARFKLTEGLINEEEELKEEINAIQARKRALEKSTDSIKKNKVELDRLTKQEKSSKTRLAIVQKQNNDIQSVNNAEQEYNDTLEDIAREKQLGLITEQEYQQRYLQALQTLVKKYADANTLTDELRKKLLDRKKELETNEGINVSAEKESTVPLIQRVIQGKSGGNEPFKQMAIEFWKIAQKRMEALALLNGYVTEHMVKDPLTGKFNQRAVDYSRYRSEDIDRGLSIKNNRPNVKTEEETKRLLDGLNKWARDLYKNNPSAFNNEAIINKFKELFPDYKDIINNIKDNFDLEAVRKTILNDSEKYTEALQLFEDKKRTAGYIDPENKEVYNAATSSAEIDTILRQTLSEFDEKKDTFTREIVSMNNVERAHQDELYNKYSKIVSDAKIFDTNRLFAPNEDGWGTHFNLQELEPFIEYIRTDFRKTLTDLLQLNPTSDYYKGLAKDYGILVKGLEQGIGTMEDFSKFMGSVYNLIHAVDVLKFNKKYSSIEGYKGDRDNYNITGQTSYNRVSKNAKLNTHEDKWTLKQSDLNDLLSRYQEAEKLEIELITKGIDTSELDRSMNDLEQQIYNKSQDIQSHLDFEFKMKRFDEIQNAISSVGNLASSIKGIGDAFDNAEDGVDTFCAAINALVTVMETVKTVIELVNFFGELFTKNQEEQAAAALVNGAAQTAAAQETVAAKGEETAANIAAGVSGAAASGSKLPFPYNLVAIAAGVAAVVAAIAGIAAIGGKFANGGIITGSGGVAGDTTLIRANVGEMVLNKHQQKNLFDLLDNGGSIGGSGQVEFKIKGADLYGSLHNYSKIKSNSGKHINL